jgi:hypothetical protein
MFLVALNAVACTAVSQAGGFSRYTGWVALGAVRQIYNIFSQMAGFYRLLFMIMTLVAIVFKIVLYMTGLAG